MTTNPWAGVEVLVDRVQAGERQALVELVRAIRPEIVGWASTLVGEQDADDLVQEVFISFLRSVAAFRRLTSVRTWVVMLVRRAAADHYRALGRRPASSETTLHALVLNQTTDRQNGLLAPDPAAVHEVWDLLGRLRPERRRAVGLTQYLGLTYEEAAEVTGTPVGTVRSRVARARQDLLDLMGPAGVGTVL